MKQTKKLCTHPSKKHGVRHACVPWKDMACAMLHVYVYAFKIYPLHAHHYVPLQNIFFTI
jgi:hypothetical protein